MWVCHGTIIPYSYLASFTTACPLGYKTSTVTSQDSRGNDQLSTYEVTIPEPDPRHVLNMDLAALVLSWSFHVLVCLGLSLAFLTFHRQHRNAFPTIAIGSRSSFPVNERSELRAKRTSIASRGFREIWRQAFQNFDWLSI